jgi:hypothetical protein
VDAGSVIASTWERRYYIVLRAIPRAEHVANPGCCNTERLAYANSVVR